MNRFLSCFNTLYIGVLWLLLSVIPLQAAQVDDIRVVIDVSGSMQKTDPNNLRKPALRLINGLIPSGSKAGVWTFGRYVNMEVKWGTVDDKWRKQADEGAKKIHSKGQFTNIESALKRATKGWDKKDPDTNRNLILLTDGKVDVSKDAAKNALSRANVLDKSIPELANKGIKVHTIALSDQTDEALLRRLALKTSGSFEVAQSADDLQRIFLHMFERATKPDTVPLSDNSFTIDKSISEMTLLVFRKGKKETGLIQPDKIKHSESQHATNVNWRFERGYDLITVSKPVPGEWSLDAEMDDDNRVMIVTELKLVVDEIPAYMTPDETLNIAVELHSNEKKISKKSFLKFVDFNLQHLVDDKSDLLPLDLKKSREIKDKGIYLQNISAPLAEGKHEIVVNADARTFTRSKRFSVEVQWPVKVEVSKTANPGIYNLSIQAREEYIKADTLQLDVSIKQPDNNEQKVEISKAGNQTDLEIKVNQQDGLHQIQIKMQAETVDGKAIKHTLDNFPVLGVQQAELEEKVEKSPVAADSSSKIEQNEVQQGSDLKPAEIVEEITEEEDSGWVNTMIYVATANMIIILIVVGSIIVMRKRKKGDSIDLFEEESIEEELLND